MLKWNVWSVSTKDGRGLVVDEGTKVQAIASAKRRNAAAARLGVGGLVFVAMPDGQVPEAVPPPP
jgi:hypothetical protein